MSLERIVEYLRRSEEAIVDDVHPLPHSTALLTPSLPLVWQLNAVRVEELDAPADELLGAVEDALGHASHRKLVVHDETAGARLAPVLANEGWNVYRLLVMVHDRPSERSAAPGVGTEVDRATGGRALAAFRREQPFGWQPEAAERATSPRRPTTRPRPAVSTPPTGWPRWTRSARSSAAADAATPPPRCWPRWRPRWRRGAIRSSC
jgi:hypothetical protein